MSERVKTRVVKIPALVSIGRRVGAQQGEGSEARESEGNITCSNRDRLAARALAGRAADSRHVLDRAPRGEYCRGQGLAIQGRVRRARVTASVIVLLCRNSSPHSPISPFPTG